MFGFKAPERKKSGVYNVGTGMTTTFNDLVKQLNKALGTELKPEYFDNPYGKTYQANTQADTANAVKFLGFKSKWKLLDAIKEYMNILYR